MEGLQTIPRENALAILIADRETSLSAIDGKRRAQRIVNVNYLISIMAHIRRSDMNDVRLFT